MKNTYKYKILDGKPEGKRPPKIPWHKLEDNIKKGLKWGFHWLRTGFSSGLLST
jgi:hypothetical protein